MKNKFYSEQDIYEIIETKGIEEAVIEGYLDPEKIKDSSLATDVRVAKKALERIASYYERLLDKLYGKD